MAQTKIEKEIKLLLEILDQAYAGRAWHGTNLRGSVRGVSAGAAAWRPDPGRHNIRELVLHAAYWKYAVRRKLTGEKRGSFRLAGSNWLEREGVPSEQEWKQDIQLLETCHRELRAAISGIKGAQLRQRPAATRYSYANLIYGAASHDLYHAGQIQLLKRLQQSGGGTGSGAFRRSRLSVQATGTPP